MIRAGILSLLTLACSPPLAAQAEQHSRAQQAGDEFEIVRSYETKQHSSDGGSSSSRGRDALIEKVIETRSGSLVLEYDHPKGSTAEERARTWQFPARILRTTGGELQLLNRSELERRVEAWLQVAKLPREACGSWYFTWNAFQIECDPQAVLKSIQAVDLTSVLLEDGASYRDPESRMLGTLRRETSPPNSIVYKAVLAVDPDAIRRSRAEMDVAVGEIMRKPVTLEAALRARDKEAISGAVTVTYEADLSGVARRRIKSTELKIKLADGSVEHQTNTETVERRRL